MALLPSSIFQPPLPAALKLLPPTGPLQWTFRFLSLIFTICTFPLIFILVPLSVCLPTPYAPLPLHSDNLPPHQTAWSAGRRGWWAYIASGFLWSLTSTGLPPDHGLGISRYLANKGLRHAEYVARQTGVIGNSGRLSIYEEDMPQIPAELCIGALGEMELPREPVHAFWLCGATPSDSPSPSLKHSVKRAKRAILWLAGGGYITGYPLNDRPIFSLANTLPLGEYVVLAPSLTRALSKERSFPIPLLDALAAYRHLRLLGFEPDEVVVIGNSAGGGLTWSLVSYLLAIQESGIGGLGVPGSVVMISPWLKLPPMVHGMCPDFVNTPQLLNAARCYLARYPISGDWNDPFKSAFGYWVASTKTHAIVRINRLLGIISGKQPLSAISPDGSKHTSLPDEEFLPGPKGHLGWFESSVFTQMSTHHPLISPSTDVSSPFVQHTLALLAKSEIRILVHCGTAEWFHDPILELVNAARDASADLTLVENLGGVHSEACLQSPERGGPARELQDQILAFLGESQSRGRMSSS